MLAIAAGCFVNAKLPNGAKSWKCCGARDTQAISFNVEVHLGGIICVIKYLKKLPENMAKYPCTGKLELA